MQTFVLQTQSVKEVVLKYQKIASMPLNFKNILVCIKAHGKEDPFFLCQGK